MGENSDARQLQKSQRADPAPQSSSLVLRGLNLSVAITLQNMTPAELPLPVLVGHKGGVSSLAFSHSGKLIASGGLDKTVRIWSVETGKEISSYTSHEGTVAKVRFSHSDRFLVSTDESGQVVLYDLQGGRVVRQFAVGGGSLLDFGISGDEQYLFVAMADGWIRKFQISNGHEKGTITTHFKWADYISIADDCSIVAISRFEDDIALMNLITNDLGEVTWIKDSELIISMMLTPDNRGLIWTDYSSQLHLHDFVSQSFRFKVQMDWEKKEDLSRDLQEDWEYLPPIRVEDIDAVEDISPGAENFDFVDDLEGLDESMPGQLLAVSQDGSIIIVNSQNTIKAFSYDGIQITGKYDGHKSIVTSVAISCDSKMVAAGAGDGTIRLWRNHAPNQFLPSSGQTDTAQGFNSTAKRIQVSGEEITEISSEEYKIYSAALEQLFSDFTDGKIGLCDRTVPPVWGLSRHFGDWDKSGEEAEVQSILDRMHEVSEAPTDDVSNDTNVIGEVFASFRARNEKSLPLEEKLRLSMEYGFFQLEDFASDSYGFAGGEAFWNRKKTQPDEEFTELVGFSRIGFNPSATLAFLHLIAHGDHYLYTFYMLLEKVQDDWHMLPEIRIIINHWL